MFGQRRMARAIHHERDPLGQILQPPQPQDTVAAARMLRPRPGQHRLRAEPPRRQLCRHITPDGAAADETYFHAILLIWLQRIRNHRALVIIFLDIQFPGMRLVFAHPGGQIPADLGATARANPC